MHKINYMPTPAASVLDPRKGLAGHPHRRHTSTRPPGHPATRFGGLFFVALWAPKGVQSLGAQIAGDFGSVTLAKVKVYYYAVCRVAFPAVHCILSKLLRKKRQCFLGVRSQKPYTPPPWPDTQTMNGKYRKNAENVLKMKRLLHCGLQTTKL